MLAVFTASLLFSTIHHAAEKHHHNDEECVAAEMGETHLHGWEFENCDLCDLQLTTNFMSFENDFLKAIELEFKPYYTSYIKIFSSQEILSFSNRGPPFA